MPTLPPGMGIDTAAGLAALNAEVSRQAALLGYLNDFWMMMALTLVTIPLLVLIRRSRAASAGVPADAAH